MEDRELFARQRATPRGPLTPEQLAELKKPLNE